MEAAKRLPIPTVGGSPEGDEWKGNALLLRARKQALLASNLANADTPGYQARDFDFQEAMRQTSLQVAPVALTATVSGHIAPASIAALRSTVDLERYSQPVQPRLDRNTVDPATTYAQLARNALLYQAAMQTFDDEYQEFKTAASDPAKR